VHYQQGVIEATYRPTGKPAPNLDKLGLPETIRELLQKDIGLILVTGQTGRSIRTALAAMVDVICEQSTKVVVTIEEQVEYLHDRGESIVKQRELGRDVLSYADGVQSAMRQAADVIVVDLVQDAHTMRAVYRAVETGHLVLAVVNSRTALDAMYRIASFFTPELLDCERYRLSVALVGVIALLKTVSEEGKEEGLGADVTVIDSSMRTGIAIGDFTQLH
jgi:twitching motility protein PilT